MAATLRPVTSMLRETFSDDAIGLAFAAFPSGLRFLVLLEERSSRRRAWKLLSCRGSAQLVSELESASIELDKVIVSAAAWVWPWWRLMQDWD